MLISLHMLIGVAAPLLGGQKRVCQREDNVKLGNIGPSVGDPSKTMQQVSELPNKGF